MNHWSEMPIYKEMTEFPSALKVRERISGNCCKFGHPSLVRSQYNLMNKGCIPLMKGGDNILATSSKCFPFQPDTLLSCLDSA